MNVEEFFQSVVDVAPGFQAVRAEHLHDYDELLSTLLMADLMRYVGLAFGAQNAVISDLAAPPSRQVVEAILVVVERGLSEGDYCVVNAIAVSFVEDFAYGYPQESFLTTLEPMLGLKAKAELQRQRNWIAVFVKLRELLFAEDPLGLLFEGNPKAYEGQAHFITSCLDDCRSQADVEAAVHAAFVKLSSPEVVGPPSKYRKTAKRIWKEVMREGRGWPQVDVLSSLRAPNKRMNLTRPSGTIHFKGSPRRLCASTFDRTEDSGRSSGGNRTREPQHRPRR